MDNILLLKGTFLIVRLIWYSAIDFLYFDKNNFEEWNG
jgi:hypothetical protein